jgi:hypothetical protein
LEALLGIKQLQQLPPGSPGMWLRHGNLTSKTHVRLGLFGLDLFLMSLGIDRAAEKYHFAGTQLIDTCPVTCDTSASKGIAIPFWSYAWSQGTK